VELVPIRGSASTELVEEVAVIVAEIVLQRLEAQRAPEWMRVDDAAQYLRTTPAAIRALIKRDKIPHHHVNGRVLFERQELDGWVRDDGT
jgi:excisionase family DNA binding protein